MAVTGVGSNYNNVYGSTYALQKNEVSKRQVASKTETKETAGTQAENTKNSASSKVSDYYSYLQKNYDCMSKGNVTISSKYLEKCAGNAEKAKELEDFLKKIPELEKQGYEQLSAHNKALGGTVTYYQQTWMINADGSIQSTVYSVTETGMTNAERMKKNMDERLEKQKEKKEEEEKVKEKREEKQEQEEKSMSTIINNYSQFYRGTESLKNYGSDSALKKDTLVRYEFNTTDEHGNKVVDKMSKEEMFQAMNEISAQYGDNVIVQFSGDGMAALIESKKGAANRELSEEEIAAKEAKNAAFQDSIIQNERETLNHLPAYSGMYEDDKTIAAALENCTNEEKAFVYDIIRRNFLVGNSGSMTEEERRANIALGMKKAEYAAENFISEDKKDAFLEAMENITKLASAGKADNNGNMDYGVNKANYLGHGSDIVCTTDPEDMMRRMDNTAYEEYKRLKSESGTIDGLKNSMRFLMNWYINAVEKNPNMVNEYEQQSKKYVEENVRNQKIDTTFADMRIDSKAAFLESLRAFQLNNPGFLSSIINMELSLQFWSR